MVKSLPKTQSLWIDTLFKKDSVSAAIETKMARRISTFLKNAWSGMEPATVEPS